MFSGDWVELHQAVIITVRRSGVMFCLEIFNYFLIVLFQKKGFEITDINTDLFVFRFFVFHLLNKWQHAFFLEIHLVWLCWQNLTSCFYVWNNFF